MTVAGIERADLSKEAFEAFAAADRVAWDIETSGLDWRIERIGTCQLHAPSVGTAIVQVGAGVPERLKTLLMSRHVLKVFHHAPFDLRFMASHWKVRVKNVACTKVASRILDPNAPDSQHSLQSLLNRRLGVQISKEQRLSNWTVDSLTAAQVAYASQDVEHLLPLYDDLCVCLDDAGFRELYDDCCSFLPGRVQLELGSWPDVFAY